ncbi:MAG: fumarylacetoacetate hydrolase family protein, partial [Proteobacteria bacterium]|nr:fumarylacetoacetate hydrolase family protein [Pseudomonadota bacterium]
MKLASLKKGGRDGTLIVVDRGLGSYTEVGDITATLQAALDDWQAKSPLLDEAYQALCAGDLAGSQPLDVDELASPLPRAYQFLDGSAYLAHVERVRRARGAEMPPSFLDDPLMYQAVSDRFLAPREDVVVASEESGIDFESEVVVVTDDVPMGVS